MIAKTNILILNDFDGIYTIPSHEFLNDRTLAIIHDYEYRHLRDLLGAELYNEFTTDLVNGVPTTQKWTDFLDGKEYLSINGCMLNYEGIKSFLVPLVWADYILHAQNYQTNIGNVLPGAENATNTGDFNLNRISNDAWNVGIEKYNECYMYLWTNISDFQHFEIYFRKKLQRGLYNKITVR